VVGAAHFAAQLPVTWRGLFYDGWQPAQVPVTYEVEQFLVTVAQDSGTSVPEARQAAAAVTAALEELTSGDQIRRLIQLSSALRDVLDSSGQQRAQPAEQKPFRCPGALSRALRRCRSLKVHVDLRRPAGSAAPACSGADRNGHGGSSPPGSDERQGSAVQRLRRCRPHRRYRVATAPDDATVGTLVLYAVESSTSGQGMGLSPVVRAAVPQVGRAVLAETGASATRQRTPSQRSRSRA
jgi:hypothetical protein